MKKLIVPVFMLSVTAMYGQNEEPDQFTRDSLDIVKVKLVRPQFRFDNRQTFVGKQTLQISGFDAGVLLSEKLRVTLGYYTMSDRLKQFDEIKDGAEFGRLVDLKYGSLNTELIFRDTRFLSFGMPLEIGAGVNTFENRNITTGELVDRQSGVVAFANFGMTATFKPMRFLGLKAMIGYRKVAYNKVKDYDFDGFFTGIGLNIDVHAITTDVKMYRLKKRYHRGNNIANAVDIITD
jgi:hypothetical protein